MEWVLFSPDDETFLTYPRCPVTGGKLPAEWVPGVESAHVFRAYADLCLEAWQWQDPVQAIRKNSSGSLTQGLISNRMADMNTQEIVAALKCDPGWSGLKYNPLPWPDGREEICFLLGEYSHFQWRNYPGNRGDYAACFPGYIVLASRDEWDDEWTVKVIPDSTLWEFLCRENCGTNHRDVEIK